MRDLLDHLGSIWYHSEPLEVSYSTNQFLGWDFFAVSYSKLALAYVIQIRLNFLIRKVVAKQTYQNSSMFKLRKLSPRVWYELNSWRICGTLENPFIKTAKMFRHCLMLPNESIFGWIYTYTNQLLSDNLPKNCQTSCLVNIFWK